jgi:hypothetical protein
MNGRQVHCGIAPRAMRSAVFRQRLLHRVRIIIAVEQRQPGHRAAADSVNNNSSSARSSALTVRHFAGQRDFNRAAADIAQHVANRRAIHRGWRDGRRAGGPGSRCAGRALVEVKPKAPASIASRRRPAIFFVSSRGRGAFHRFLADHVMAERRQRAQETDD